MDRYGIDVYSGHTCSNMAPLFLPPSPLYLLLLQSSSILKVYQIFRELASRLLLTGLVAAQSLAPGSPIGPVPSDSSSPCRHLSLLVSQSGREVCSVKREVL